MPYASIIKQRNCGGASAQTHLKSLFDAWHEVWGTVGASPAEDLASSSKDGAEAAAEGAGDTWTKTARLLLPNTDLSKKSALVLAAAASAGGGTDWKLLLSHLLQGKLQLVTATSGATSGADHVKKKKTS